MAVIELDNIYKAYDNQPVLRGLSLNIEQGEIYGLLGPNGSGKSTLLLLLLGFLRPEHGRLRVLGTNNLGRTAGRIGYLPERLRYHTRFSPREYLRYMGMFNDMPRADLARRVTDELAAVGLGDAADRPMSTFSRGMLQRVGIAQALLHEPELLLIDEPTGGLDPNGQREMLDVLAGLRERGCTVLLTTHYLDEIEQVCDRVGILFDGRIVVESSVAALRQPSRYVLITVDHLPEQVATRLKRLSPAVQTDERSVGLEPNTPELQARVLRVLLEANVAVLALAPQSKPLADLYTRAIRGELADVPLPPAEVASHATAALPDAMFAPPGHPDANGTATHQTSPVDPLLNELLGRDEPGKQ